MPLSLSINTIHIGKVRKMNYQKQIIKSVIRDIYILIGYPSGIKCFVWKDFKAQKTYIVLLFKKRELLQNDRLILQ